MNKVHFVGIKGSGMSALAQILFDMNYDVTGSDVNKYFFTEDPLRRRGIAITEFAAENIDENMIVVASKAFGEDNPEIKRAMELGVLQYYYDFLGEFTKSFDTSIAISGCHGKTTTTGLMAHVLSGLKKTSYLIGDGTGRGVSGSKYFVFEACEYKNHFLAYKPDYAVITNIDFDHPDFFKDKLHVIESFYAFSKNVRKGLVVYGDQEETNIINPDIPVWRYGFGESNQVRAMNVDVEDGNTSFDVFIHGEFVDRVRIPMTGEHHILNSLAVCAVIEMQMQSIKGVVPLFESFPGVKRRFNEVFIKSNVLIDDYAHHPTEIKATLQSIRLKYPDKKAVVLFQPHTYSRTEAFLEGFVSELSQFDEVYLTDIFGSAREKDKTMQIDSQTIVDKIKSNKDVSVQVGARLPKEFFEYENTVLAFLGAGDVNKYKEEFLLKSLSI